MSMCRWKRQVKGKSVAVPEVDTLELFRTMGRLFMCETGRICVEMEGVLDSKDS